MNCNSICRLCLLDDIGCMSIFNSHEEGQDGFLVQKIMQLANVQIFEGDGLPAVICRNCVGRVEGFFQFKIQIEKSDFFLRQQVCSFQGVTLSSLPATGKTSENVKSDHVPIIKNDGYIQESSWTDNVDNFTPLQNCQHLPENVHISESQEVTNVILEDSQQTFVNLTNIDKEDDGKALLNLSHQDNSEHHTHFQKDHEITGSTEGVRVLRKNVVGRDKPVNNYYQHFFHESDGLDFEKSKTSENLKDLYNLDEQKKNISLQIIENEDKELDIEQKAYNKHDYNQEKEQDNNINNIEVNDKEKSKPKTATIIHCDECDMDFDSPSSLKKHQSHHAKQPLKCSYCTKSFKQNWYLNLHIRTHTGERPFNCNICSKTFTDKNSLNAHMRITHFTERTQVCSFCGKAFKLKKQLDRHERIHTGHNYHRCEVCGKLFTQKSNLMKHLVLHSGEKPFPCPFCDKPFAQKDNLNIHILRHHSQQNPVVCDVCGKLFKNKMTLTGHKKNKHSDNVKHIICEVCGKVFPDRSLLNSHKWVHHTGAPVECNVCGKSYPHARAVRVHKRIVHSDVRKFCCDVCGIGFKTGQTLKHHKVVHTGERAFSCEECGRSFGQKTALKTHQRIHSGVEPYTCLTCGESFKWKQTCDKHILKCVGKTSKDNVIMTDNLLGPS